MAVRWRWVKTLLLANEPSRSPFPCSSQRQPNDPGNPPSITPCLFPKRTSAKTILVIDDREQNLQLLGTLLGTTGHEVIAATSGKEAFEPLAASTPALVLLDVLMPEMNGIEVCRRIKEEERWKDLPVIFLSAADDKNLIVEALESGGVDYVTKPFNKAELLARVRTHLALRRAREELRHLAEDKDELLGILTHDFGNHLAGIHLNATVLERHLDAIPAQLDQRENLTNPYFSKDISGISVFSYSPGG